jgi:CheY-like chemotaxis protein
MSLSILLIEDNPDHALLVEMALEALTPPAELHLIADGKQALDCLQSAGALPDIVLLDLKLPRVDGLAVLQAMRQSARWRAVPVIVLTTSNRPADVEACLASGANAYLSKITDLSSLATRLAALLPMPVG